MSKLTHLDESGSARMVDVGEKLITERLAVASGFVSMSADALSMVLEASNKKGDVLAIARVAGIQAAKQCSNLIPLCHPLMLDSAKVNLELGTDGIKIEAICKISGRTGVEMEALTAVSVAALTIYDMCKAADKAMIIRDIQLERKVGGRGGEYQKDQGL
ncbi:MAG: cyclic pyranopterin monophosphate synthase MoaC [Deltaproteobacteria bacterium]|jgi:cyclic pyranopterin phosphate synthase|nr:cyclic pyranopterin monophosphate synthase MoaC [Deltaproteobacteria bacterium]|tara:strand:+ start:14736 stop:15215 length:480 start_codon:yes stop_codon:yes gene_type:complete